MKKSPLLFFSVFLAFILFSNIFVSNASYGAGALKISLDEAIQMALKNSEELQIKKHEISKSEFALDEAKAALYPQSKAEAKWQKNIQQPYMTDSNGVKTPPNNPAALNRPYEASLGIQVNQVLYAFGKLTEAIDLAHEKIALSEASGNLSKNDIIYNTKMAYYSALAAQKRVEIAKASLDNARQNKEILERKFSEGRPMKGDSIKVAADLASRVPSYQDALSRKELDFNRLKMIMGLSDSEQLELLSSFKKDFSPLSIPKREDILSASPEIKLAEKAVVLNEKVASLKNKLDLPTLSAFGALNYMGSGRKPEIGDTKHFQAVSAIGLSLQIPIDIGGSVSAQYKGALEDSAQARLRKIQVEKNLNLELDNAIDEYQGLLITYKANLEAVNLAQSSFSLTRLMFESGKLALINLNDAEMLLTGQKTQEETTLFRIHCVLARIEKLTGKDLSSRSY